MDELTRRRLARQRSPLATPPDDGDLEVIAEDLGHIHGMVTEVRAEAAAVHSPGVERLRVDLNRLDDATTRAIATVAEITPRTEEDN